MENLIERINEIIETENLRERTKKPTKVHRRWFLFSLLRNKGIIFQKIGDMFEMDHATILYGVRQVEIYKKAKDEFYLMDTADLEEIFNDVKIQMKSRDLVQDVLDSKNYHDLVKIKKRLQNNVYKILDKNDLD